MQAALRQALRIFISEQRSLWSHAALTGTAAQRACQFHIARALQDQVGRRWDVDMAYDRSGTDGSAERHDRHDDSLAGGQPSSPGEPDLQRRPRIGRTPAVVVHDRSAGGSEGKLLAIEILTRATPALWRHTRHLLCEVQWDLGYHLAVLVDLGMATPRDARRSPVMLSPRWEWFRLDRRYPTVNGYDLPDEQVVAASEAPVFDMATLESLAVLT